ncbi:MAG: hypothetical protein KDG58_22165, partial [Anaerolineae bacterium]|nr:hypothetical protein [Anaerolineae bacterium]
AMAMHPDERPANVVEVRNSLVGTRPSDASGAGTAATPYERWIEALRSNRILAGAAVGLIVLALLVSLLSPRLPAQPGELGAATPVVTSQTLD